MPGVRQYLIERETVIKEYLSGLWFPAQYLVGAMLLLCLGYLLKLHGVKDYGHWMGFLTGAFTMLQVQLGVVWISDQVGRWYVGQWQRIKSDWRSALGGDRDE